LSPLLFNFALKALLLNLALQIKQLVFADGHLHDILQLMISKRWEVWMSIHNKWQPSRMLHWTLLSKVFVTRPYPLGMGGHLPIPWCGGGKDQLEDGK